MRIQYQSLPDEFVEFSLRAYELAQAALPWWRRDASFGALLTAGIVYLGYRSPFSFVIGLLAGAWAFPRWQRLRQRHYSRREYERWYGDRPEVLVEMEPRAPGFWHRQAGAETLYPWDQVLSASELPDGAVELRLKHEGLIWVSPRAFPDATARAHFLADVKRCWTRGDVPPG
jgi:hypothetical protein